MTKIERGIRDARIELIALLVSMGASNSEAILASYSIKIGG